MRAPKYHWHPLAFLFYARRYTIPQGMNWLQERGHISDLCVEVESIAYCDVVSVLTKANALFYLKPNPR